MLESSEAYRAAITGDHRRILLRAVVDIVDPSLEYEPPLNSGQTSYSRSEQLRDRSLKGGDPYITLEPNRWLLDGNFRMLGELDQTGCVLTNLSRADGTFSREQWVEEAFSGVHILQACTVYFPGADWDGVAEDFTVEIKKDGVVLHSRSFTGNRASKISVTGFTAYDPDAIRVNITKWSMPGRLARVIEIIPGVYEVLDNSDLSAFSVTQQVNFSCLSLPYGTLVLSMDNQDRRFEPRNKAGLFQSIEEGQSIDAQIGVELADGSTEYKRLGMFFQHSGGWKVGSNGLTMEWTLVDIIGLLARRTFFPPETLPTTLEGWAAELVHQLGNAFAHMYEVDPRYAGVTLQADRATVSNCTCGEILRWICMATGTWPRADAETGYLAVEPYWEQGNKVTLDNLNDYPTLKANDDLAAITFVMPDNSRVTVSGTATAAGNTVTVRNPFITTKDQALTAARQILSTYGGSKIEITGRGDPTSELGDVDTVWLDESQATTGRRVSQTLAIRNGVLQGCRATLVQPSGSYLYQQRQIITESCTWQAPAGVRSLRLILVGSGGDGQNGTDGSYNTAGVDGANGSGGKVWADTISINEGQVFVINIGAETVFGGYSSAQGAVFENGYTDIASGDCWARSGVAEPQPGSGDGGAGGKGGARGYKRTYTATVPKLDPVTGEIYYEEQSVSVTDVTAKYGLPGVKGAIGCAVIYWDKEAEA